MSPSNTKQKAGTKGKVAELEEAVRKFSLTYGRDDQRLAKWQLLCIDCGVESGTSIRKCKAVRLSGLYMSRTSAEQRRAGPSHGIGQHMGFDQGPRQRGPASSRVQGQSSAEERFEESRQTLSVSSTESPGGK